MNDLISAGGVPTVVGFGTLLNAIETAISQPSFNIETVERMFALVVQMQTMQARAEFNDARARIDEDIQPIVKNATNTHLRNKYADLDAILTALKPVCAKYGVVIGFSQGKASSPEMFRLEMTLSRGPYSETSHIEIPSRIAGAAGNRIGANDQQGVGILVTYARRYLLKMAFNLSDEDTDGEQPGGRAPPPPPVQNHGVETRPAQGNGGNGARQPAQTPPQGAGSADPLDAAREFLDRLSSHLSKAQTGEHIGKVADWAKSKLPPTTPAVVIAEVARRVATARAALPQASDLDLDPSEALDRPSPPAVSDKAQEMLAQVADQDNSADLTALLQSVQFSRDMLPLPDRERDLIDQAAKARGVALDGTA